MKGKRKLTAAEKDAKKQRKRDFETVFINGRMKRVRRPQLIDGLPVDEFAMRNADPIWAHQNEMWELIESIESGNSEDSALASERDDNEVQRIRLDRASEASHDPNRLLNEEKGSGSNGT